MMAGTPLDLRSEVIRTRTRYLRGEVPLDALYAAADRYIAAVIIKAKECAPHIRRRFRPPSRAYVIRAL